MNRRSAVTLSLASLLASVLLPAIPARGQADTSENQFGISDTLFVTLAAINAAGYDDGLDSPLNQRFQIRSQVREQLSKRNIPCLAELKDFYKAHLKPNATVNLSQYISFALSINGAPNFDTTSGKVPPDVQALTGLSELLARFYKEANLEDLWKRSQPAYLAAIHEYQDPVITTLFEANGYLRNPSGSPGRRFQIYLDLLAAPNQIQVRSYREDYFVVITPSTTPVIDEIRDAYLSYLLDPLTFRYSAIIDSKKSLRKYAEDAPALDLAYKDDFSLLVTKCLIKAIDTRVMHDTPERKQASINRAMQEGFVLTAAFADLLPAYEKQQDAMRLYYPDLVKAIDVRKEEKRLRTVEFVQTVAPRVIAPPAALELPAAEQSLQTAEGLYEQHDLESAQKLFKRVFEQTTDKSMQGRAYYGLARIAVRQNNKDAAVELFQRTVDANPNPPITAWAHVYLGRLAMAAGDSDKANAQFKLALAIEGASVQAKDAAEKGVQSISSQGQQQ